MKSGKFSIIKITYRLIPALAVVLLQSTQLPAQDIGQPKLIEGQPEVSDEKPDVRVLAARYLELKNAKASVDAGVQAIVDNFLVQFPNANIESLYEILEEAIGWDTMGDEMLRITSETYSADELEALIEFYSSPVGTAALLKGQHVADQYQKVLMEAYNEATEKMTDEMFEPEESSSGRAVGDEVRWTEYRNIESDDCVSIPFVGKTCHTVKYKFELRGVVAAIDHQSQVYDVHLSGVEIVPQERVSAMYWAYKGRAQAWADQQQRRSIEFRYVD